MYCLYHYITWWAGLQQRKKTRYHNDQQHMPDPTDTAFDPVLANHVLYYVSGLSRLLHTLYRQAGEIHINTSHYVYNIG